ncbi:MAG TPA: c-type cytochrome domain-containing protein, partial [Vicinamibacterales bacterium]|nr:c-type cytochrome domain-containing protein [Vicinamibacterales bacterium]
MRRAAVWALVFPLATATLRAQAPRPADPRPVLDTYCVGCHNARLRRGDLVLEGIDTARIGDAPDIWERVVRKLRTREMPPAGARRPDEPTYRGVIGSLETSLDAAAEAAPRPGRVPVHRLNRTEYANAIR